MTIPIQAEAVKDGQWWVAEFSLDERTYGTQARRIDQLQDMVADAAALMSGADKADFDVAISVDYGPYTEAVQQYQEKARDLARAEEETSLASRRAVAALRQAGMSMRDIGTIMGISYQRAAQLAR